MSGRDVDEAEPSRKALDEGIVAISRQLELLRAGPTLGEPSDDAGVIAELRAELAALQEERRSRFG